MKKNRNKISYSYNVLNEKQEMQVDIPDRMSTIRQS